MGRFMETEAKDNSRLFRGDKPWRLRVFRKVCPSLCLTLSNGHVQRAGGQGGGGNGWLSTT